MSWLFEAKKRYNLIILNYMVTDNHIHLLVADNGDRECIPKSIQLLAGRTGQEFNQRKNRKGAFWEDRYHATAVAKESYLANCMDYIDMNMVRAGVVSHPAEWQFCGYYELMHHKQRYRLLDTHELAAALGLPDSGNLAASRERAIESVLGMEIPDRNKKWTQSIAVGSKNFVLTVKEQLGIRSRSRNIHKDTESYQLRESKKSYNAVFDPENDVLSPKNSLFWNVYSNI